MLVKHQSFCVSIGMNNVPSHQTYYKYYQGYSVVQSTETKWVIIDCRLIECLFYTNYFSLTVSTVSTTIPTPLVTTKGKSVLLRPRLHETGTKSIRDDLVSVIVFIIDVYMRPG